MESIKKELQKDFFGIDNQIDEILEMVEPWSKVPECYIRPLIINLWGMTGTGKTSLIRRVAKLLDLPLIEIDLGSFASSSGLNDFTKKFWDDYWELNNKPCIILIDEFHIARTVDEGGSEIDRDNLRGLWSLLSDGKMVVGDRLDECRELDWFFDDAVADYMKALDEIKRLKKSKDPEDKSELDYLERSHVKNSIKYWMLKSICKILGVNHREILKELEQDFVRGVDKLRELSKGIGFQPVLDFSHSLIFVSGNLDKVYPRVRDFDPDLNLEALYQASLNINFAEVKYELSTRFRPEQIGRLGNNHIIYPALNKEAYIKIIHHDMDRVSSFFKDFTNFGFELEFDKSVEDLVYREGVVPAQGARSVLSTLTSLLEASVITFVANYISKNEEPSRKRKTKVDVSFDFDSREMAFKTKDFEFKRKVKLKVDDLRTPKWNNASIARAVHEAGHILSSLIFLKAIPNRATAYSIGSHSAAVVENFTNDQLFVMDSVESLLAQIKVGLGSHVAQETVFGGREKVSGTYADMETLTKYAVTLVNTYGYRRDSLGYTVLSKDGGANAFIERLPDSSYAAQTIINECYKEVTKEFNDNLGLLLALSKRLVSQPQLDKEEIRELSIKHGVSHFVPSPYTEMFMEIYKKHMGGDLKSNPFFKRVNHD